MNEQPCGDPQPGTMAITFDVPATEPVAIQLDERALARQRRAARIAEAKAYESLGQRVLKIKAKKLGELGEYIVTKLGVKQIGHGTIISSSDNADQYIARCDALISELMAKDPPCDPEVIVSLMGLVKAFNQQLLDSGEAHLRIDRQPSVVPESNQLSVPFPAGTPMVIAMGHPQPTAQPAIEAGGPEV